MVDINLGEGQGEAANAYSIDPTWAFFTSAPRKVVAHRQVALELLGRAMLRLRLYIGWTQRDLERASGVDQTTISRFERGRHQGLSVYRMAALLAAMNVAIVDFMPPHGPPPTALELMLYGNRWDRAGKAADRRLKRRIRPRTGRVR